MLARTHSKFFCQLWDFPNRNSDPGSPQRCGLSLLEALLHVGESLGAGVWTAWSCQAFLQFSQPHCCRGLLTPFHRVSCTAKKPSWTQKKTGTRARGQGEDFKLNQSIWLHIGTSFFPNCVMVLYSARLKGFSGGLISWFLYLSINYLLRAHHMPSGENKVTVSAFKELKIWQGRQHISWSKAWNLGQHKRGRFGISQERNASQWKVHWVRPSSFSPVVFLTGGQLGRSVLDALSTGCCHRRRRTRHCLFSVKYCGPEETQRTPVKMIQKEPWERARRPPAKQENDSVDVGEECREIREQVDTDESRRKTPCERAHRTAYQGNTLDPGQAEPN